MFFRENAVCQRKAVTKAKPAILYFEEIKHQCLIDIKAIVEIAEIPIDLAGLDDKRQIIAVFARSLTRGFLLYSLFTREKPKNFILL